MSDKPRSIHVRVPPRTYSTAERLARGEERSLSKWAARIIQREIDRIEAEEAASET